MEDLKKIKGPEVEDPRLAPFNIDVVYAAGGGTPHGRYLKILVVLC
jgi:hypothetical protein